MSVSGSKMLGHYTRGPGGYKCPCCQSPGTTRWRKRIEAREVAREIDEEFLRRMQEIADDRATHGPCTHCGRDPAAGFTRVVREGRYVQFCHPDDRSLPDCYRRVTVYCEPVGTLRDVD